MFGLFPDLNVRVVGTEVALAAGVGIAGHSHVEGVFWVAGIALAHRTVGPEMADVVALLAAVLGGDGRFQDIAVERCSEEDHG